MGVGEKSVFHLFPDDELEKKKLFKDTTAYQRKTITMPTAATKKIFFFILIDKNLKEEKKKNITNICLNATAKFNVNLLSIYILSNNYK